MRSKTIKMSMSVLLLQLLLALPCLAQDATFTIYDSTFNELGASLVPLKFNGRHREWFCDGKWNATLTNLVFAVSTSGVTIKGEIKGSWCDISFAGTLNASGDITYDPKNQVVIVKFESAPVELKKKVDLLLGTVTVSFGTVDVAPYIRIPPIRIGPMAIPRVRGMEVDNMAVTPIGISLVKHNGYIELYSVVSIR